MEGGIKKEYIIAAVLVIALILAIIISKVTTVNLSVGIGTAQNGHDNCLISSYEEFTTIAEEMQLNTSVEVDLKRKEYSSYYNEEFFKKHKLAMVVNREDSSRNFVHSIDDVAYSNGKKNADVSYTHKEDGYAGTLGKAWYNVMIVELDKKVETVNFVKTEAESKKK